MSAQNPTLYTDAVAALKEASSSLAHAMSICKLYQSNPVCGRLVAIANTNAQTARLFVKEAIQECSVFKDAEDFVQPVVIAPMTPEDVNGGRVLTSETYHWKLGQHLKAINELAMQSAPGPASK